MTGITRLKHFADYYSFKILRRFSLAKIPPIIHHNQLLWWFLGVADTNDIILKIEKTLNNTHTTTQKRTNNSFRNTKKHPLLSTKFERIFPYGTDDVDREAKLTDY